MANQTDRAKLIFMNACRYAKATLLLNERMQTDSDLFLPSFVNAALSMELYFKTLYHLEYDKDYKNSHDFSKIFDKLKENTKQKLITNFDHKLLNRDMTDVKQIEQAASTSIPRDLINNLDHWSKVFVQVRYIYDSKNQHIMIFAHEIVSSLREVILEYKPEWKKATQALQ